ncbi:MAG: hypothetical protein JJU00_17955 [Opitutales bacterium]|nr:hypothetical protein [Opitutales bacterium]
MGDSSGGKQPFFGGAAESRLDGGRGRVHLFDMRIQLLYFLFAVVPGVLCALDLPTAEVALVGRFAAGPAEAPTRVDAAGFGEVFGSEAPADWPAEAQARQFFRNGGEFLTVVRIDPHRTLAEALAGAFPPAAPRGLGWMELLPDIGLLVVPELTKQPEAVRDAALERLRDLAAHRHFTLVLEPPEAVDSVAAALVWRETLPEGMDFAAVYYPRLRVDAAAWSGGSSGVLTTVGASGSVAARIAKTDAAHGIWRSPAGLNATLAAEALAHPVTDVQAGDLNTAHINTIRDFTGSGQGIVIFGVRTLDRTDPEKTFLAAARTQRWIAHRLRRSLAFAAFESNDEALWSTMRVHARDFLFGLYSQGAFAGTVVDESYFVRCDASTTPVEDILQHRVNLVFGVALIRPAEFFVTTLTLPTFDPAREPSAVPLRLTPQAGDAVTLFHFAAAGFHHTLETSETLDAPSWSAPDGGSAVMGDDAWKRWDLKAVPGPRFFRVRMDR